MRAVLQIQNGADAGRQILLRRGELRVGRSWLADLTCQHDEQMSDVHFKVFREGELWHFADLTSASSSLINGCAAAGITRLFDGDTISAGKTQFHVQIENGRSNGRPVPVREVATASTPTPAPSTCSRTAQFTIRQCESGLVRCQGTCSQMPPHMLASQLAASFDAQFIVDVAKAGSSVSQSEHEEWLLDWIPEQSRQRISPRIFAESQVDQCELFQHGWGQDGMIALYYGEDVERDELYRQIRKLAGMLMRPSVVLPQITQTASRVIEDLFASIEAILVEDVALATGNTVTPPDWCVLARPDFVQVMQELGLQPTEI